jgi:hypothetical protein
MCTCELCIRLKSIREHIEALPEEHREYWDNMVEGMLHVEFDNDYYKAIMEGGWPSGREVLESALAKYPVEIMHHPV